MNPRDWRMLKPCADCPFSDSSAGTHMRNSLRPGRMATIKRELRGGSIFHCHKTTTEDSEGETIAGKDSRLCAGALAYQEEQGVSSNYQRVCENLDWISSNRKKR